MNNNQKNNKKSIYERISKFWNYRFLIGVIVLFLIIAIILIIYFRYYNIISLLESIVTLVFTAALVCVTIIYAHNARRTAAANEFDIAYRALLSTIDKYQTNEIDEVIKDLWAYYSKYKGDEKAICDNFREEYKKNKRCAINNSRRKITVFFKHIAILFDLTIKMDFLKKLFSKTDIDIIPKILIPLNKEQQDIEDDKNNRERSEYVDKELFMELNDFILKKKEKKLGFFQFFKNKKKGM